MERQKVQHITRPNGQIVTVVDGVVWTQACTTPPNERSRNMSHQDLPNDETGRPTLKGQPKESAENGRWMDDF